ncbi:MAG: cation transporter [Bacilli bacterium]|nr:cation transporter [Bacilli bacterium]
MKKEKNILLVAMFLNLIVASIKLISGIMFGFSSLIADSLHSFSDFVTDIIASVASKIGQRRANKKYPFGYGMAENIANFIIGIILFLLGVFILVESFNQHEVELTGTIFIILITTIILKLATILMLYSNGKKLNSNRILASVKESITDLISSVIVLIVSILLLFKDKYPVLGYANTIGSILISLIVFYIAIKMMLENMRYLLGINENNEEVKEKLNNLIKENKLIKDYEIKLMKIGTYYNLYLTIELEPTITLKQLFTLEQKLKKDIKALRLKIKFIEIEPIEYD